MIKFDVEKVLETKKELEVLLDKHYEELTLNKDVVKLKPIWSLYKELEDKNQFVLFTARDNNELIGYSAFFLKSHIHYEDLIVASNDVLFLKSEYRLGTTGIKLLKYSEQKVKELGANKITWHVKASNDFRPILHRMGYFDEDVIVGKIL
jgi:GNAT superfamily N-acetyltransferase